MLRTAVVFVTIVIALLALRLLAWRVAGLVSRLTARLADVLQRVAGRGRPRASRLLAARVNRDRFSGMPLTLLVLTALCILALFGGLAGIVLGTEGVPWLDERINQALSAVRSNGVLAAAAWLTDAGASASIIVVSLVATGLAWAHRRRILIVPLWFTVIGSQLTTYALKYGLARARPEAVTEITAITPSFPSGHATSAMAVYGFVAFLIARELPSARARFEVAWWTAVVIALVGLSRMVLGLHYASDVAAGFLVGGFWLLVGFALAEHLSRRGHSVESGKG